MSGFKVAQGRLPVSCDVCFHSGIPGGVEFRSVGLSQEADVRVVTEKVLGNAFAGFELVEQILSDGVGHDLLLLLFHFAQLIHARFHDDVLNEVAYAQINCKQIDWLFASLENYPVDLSQQFLVLRCHQVCQLATALLTSYLISMVAPNCLVAPSSLLDMFTFGLK